MLPKEKPEESNEPAKTSTFYPSPAKTESNVPSQRHAPSFPGSGDPVGLGTEFIRLLNQGLSGSWETPTFSLVAVLAQLVDMTGSMLDMEPDRVATYKPLLPVPTQCTCAPQPLDEGCGTISFTHKVHTQNVPSQMPSYPTPPGSHHNPKQRANIWEFKFY